MIRITLQRSEVGCGNKNQKKETEALGIRPGDVITNERGYRILNDRVFSGKSC